MKDLMQYKGYYGSVSFDEDDTLFYGKIEFIKALVSYEAKDAKGIIKAFHNAVDDYLSLCKKENIIPEKPFKGSFNVRVGEELHRQTAVAAELQEVSINKFVCFALAKAVTNILKKNQRHYR